MFVWDDAKDAANKAKHGIGFDAAYEFDESTAARFDRTREEDGESRIAVVGYLRGKLHTMIYTRREEFIRIISLRRSNKKEEKAYEKATKN
jgi:uncharacterized DUF497 family protein